MIKLMDLLQEAKQVGILYHYTNSSNFEKIINNNIILEDILNRGMISFTRNGAGFHKFGECRFVIDGTSMSNKFKIVPDSLARLPNKQGKFIKNGITRYKEPHELQGEERIYDVSKIDLKPYLLKIEIISTDFLYEDDIKNLTNKIKRLTNVPFAVSNSGIWKPYKN